MTNSLGLAGWSAQLEVQRVDLTLLPPPNHYEVKPIYLEFKHIPSDYWGNWREVYHDLACTDQAGHNRAKPKADWALCFQINPISKSSHSRRTDTEIRYQQYHASIPQTSSCSFQPILGLPPLWLAASSPEFSLQWQNPVLPRWPNGYEALIRILWVSAHQPDKATISSSFPSS